MIAVTIYKGRDNIISLGLKADGQNANVSASTRMTLKIGDDIPDMVVDSNVHPSAFDWTTNGVNGQVDIDIAELNGIDKGTFRCLLTIYDATYPNGLVWDELSVRIK